MDIRLVVLSFYFITLSCEAHLVKHVLDHADRTVSGLANAFSGGLLGGGLKLNFNAEINSRGESASPEERPHHHGGLLGLLHHNRHGPPPVHHEPPPINNEPPPMHHGPPPLNHGPQQNYQGHQAHYGNGGNHGYDTNSESAHHDSDKSHPYNSQNTNSYSYAYAEAGSFSSSNSEVHPHQNHKTPSKYENTVDGYPASDSDKSNPKYAHVHENTDEHHGTYPSESSYNFPKHDEQMNNHHNHGGSYGTNSYNNNQGQHKHESDKNKPKEYERTSTYKTDQKEINNDQPYYIPLGFEDVKHDGEKVDVSTPDKDKFKRDENKNNDSEEYAIDIRSNFDQ